MKLEQNTFRGFLFPLTVGRSIKKIDLGHYKKINRNYNLVKHQVTNYDLIDKPRFPAKRKKLCQWKCEKFTPGIDSNRHRYSDTSVDSETFVQFEPKIRWKTDSRRNAEFVRYEKGRSKLPKSRESSMFK